MLKDLVIEDKGHDHRNPVFCNVVAIDKDSDGQWRWLRPEERDAE